MQSGKHHKRITQKPRFTSTRRLEKGKSNSVSEKDRIYMHVKEWDFQSQGEFRCRHFPKETFSESKSFCESKKMRLFIRE